LNSDAPSQTAKDQARAAYLLQEAPFACVAMIDGVQPYSVPMNFAYDAAAERLYFHTGPGRKSAALAEHHRVCVVVAADAAFDQGATPCSDGFTFRSVILEGSATLLGDRAEREAALRTIVAKYDPGAADMPFDGDILTQTLVYAVSAETISYKELPRRGAG
jgi:nitroimidazol reductase NimA-like FMN-containing flavoprotein (pyridoxamine 5'-phosphate oxidase superfamily)